MNAVLTTPEIAESMDELGPLAARDQFTARASIHAGTMQRCISEKEYFHAAMTAESLVDAIDCALNADGTLCRDGGGEPLGREETRILQITKAAAQGLIGAMNAYASHYQVTFASTGKHSPVEKQAMAFLKAAVSFADKSAKLMIKSFG